jgi:hypothetical protein
VLAGVTAVRDLSSLGKIEVRGEVAAIDVDAEVVRLGPRRALVLCDAERCTELRTRLPGLAVEMTGGLRALSSRVDPFRLFVSQELGHYLAEVVLDVLEGLG